MPTTGFSDNFTPDFWVRDLARRVRELVSEPELMRHFRDKLDEYWTREFNRAVGLRFWWRERGQHLMNARLSHRLRDLFAGAPPNHPDWVAESYPGTVRGAWMPREFTLDNEPDISPALPLKDYEPTRLEAYVILAALNDHDGVLHGVTLIVLKHDPQSDSTDEVFSIEKRNISFQQLLEQIPKLTPKDRPALEQCLAAVCADLKVPIPAAGCIEAAAVQVMQPAEPSFVQITCTLDQMAALVGKSKRTLENYKAKGSLPPPDVKGRRGQADEWFYDTVRTPLESLFNRKLPTSPPWQNKHLTSP